MPKVDQVNDENSRGWPPQRVGAQQRLGKRKEGTPHSGPDAGGSQVIGCGAVGRSPQTRASFKIYVANVTSWGPKAEGYLLQRQVDEKDVELGASASVASVVTTCAGPQQPREHTSENEDRQ